jgi:hypothetical protein
VVLAQDRDFIAREPAYHYLLQRAFEEHGTKIRALNDRGDDSPEGERTDGILDQLAKYERAKIAERTLRGMMRKAREGRGVVTRPASAPSWRSWSEIGLPFSSSTPARCPKPWTSSTERNRIYRMLRPGITPRCARHPE